MKIYRNHHTDPYFNLASEEYLLFHENEPCFMLWQNERSVILGRNQNAYAEIDRTFTEANHIHVVRRLTGGGAVFHDIGNVNYTFIVPEEKEYVLNFQHFATPILHALRTIGVEATLSGRNDLLVDGKKISGNAQCVMNGKILHHGTLLFSTDLEAMQGALRVDPNKIASKGIKSVRSRVANLSSYLPSLTVTDFMHHLAKAMDGEIINFSDSDMANIAALATGKYRTWEWNFGTSKEFGTSVKGRFEGGSVSLSYTATAGILREVQICGDFFAIGDIPQLEAELIGCRILREELRERINGSSVRLRGITGEELSSLFFL